MYIKALVTAHSKKESFIQTAPDHVEITVRQKAEMNQANKRVLELFRLHFPDCIVKIVSGHHSPHKIVSLEEK